jgi:GDPmannose 4,6-dehydratase
MNNNKPTSLVTGCTGQTGSFLCELLLSKGHNIVGMKRRTSLLATDRIDHLLNNPFFKLEYGNMSDAASLWNLLIKYKPDFIFNAAAQSHVKVSFEVSEETIDVVGLGVVRLLNAYKAICPQAKFVQFSSSEQFGSNPPVPQNEETKMIPASPYACAKLLSYMAVKNYRVGYNLFASNAICFNNTSPRRGETFVTRKITQAAARIKLGRQHKLFLGNIEAKRDWTYSGDIAQGVYKIATHDKPDDFVLASGQTHSVKEFLELVFDYAGLNWESFVEIDERLLRPQEVPLLLGDSTKARTELGWAPTLSFIELAHLMYDSDYEIAKKLL